ncbi:diguanylate cyclase [Thalassomonas sp. M1454]|uniref:sensor domain-containing diguanylate cyclase n=1 Tax=Thalassomonas sp. M1454 TaxID=2594477 RepID=UPI00118105A2|nr:diguanylate cyclase [Thalassomonas sp. M1454]TRX54915.1 GGDEF domain-containing protein [Thalassomonas sp. M1454]
MTFFKNITTLLSFFILTLVSNASLAESNVKTVLVDGSEDGTSIHQSIQYLVDKDSELSVLQVSQSHAFKSVSDLNNENSWLGKVEGSVWTRVILKNPTQQAIEVNFEYPFIQPSTVYLHARTFLSNNKFITKESDIRKTSNNRAIATPRLSIPLSLQPGESKEVLLETFSDIATPRFSSFRIWSTKSLVKASNIEHIIFGMVISFTLLSAIASIVLYRFLKEKFFIWYSLFAVSSIPVLGLTTGILNLYVPNLDYHPLGTISMVVMMAAGVQFIRAYSNAAYHSIKADKLLHLTLTLVLAALPLAIIGFHDLAMQIQQLAIFIFPVAIITAIYCGVLGEKQMSTMVLAKILFFITLMVTNLQAWGWIKPTYGLVFLPTIGMVAQLTCLIWAMYCKARTHYFEGSLEDQNTITDAYQQAYALQEQVKEQNQMLKTAKEQAEFEARTDMLTHLPNRRAFMNLAKMAIAQASRQNKPLSFIAFDIDNFKQINDQYGHPAGDETLKVFAELTREIIRASDFCGRIGGEEFMIGCHNNRIGDAHYLAERLRKSIEDCVIKFDDFEFSTTVSVGIAEVVDGDDLEAVIKKSDEAMYISKTQGKNKVTHYAA